MQAGDRNGTAMVRVAKRGKPTKKSGKRVRGREMQESERERLRRSRNEKQGRGFHGKGVEKGRGETRVRNTT